MPKPPSWNEIRSASAVFAASWAGVTQEASESQTFWNDFLAIFGIDRRRVAYFEARAKRSTTGNRGRVDLFWPGTLLVEHKSAGKDLDEAERQAMDYLDNIAPQDFPRLIIVSDFNQIRVRDLEQGGEPFTFPLAQLPQEVDRFGLLAGYRKRDFTLEQQTEATIKAAQLMGRLYDELTKGGYEGHESTILMTRLLFLLFGDDTGMWERGLLSEFLETRTHEDGSDLGPELALLFQTVDRPEENRSTSLDDLLCRFPYINGGIFQDRIDIPSFDKGMRKELIACGSFDWTRISPAIFGSLFQALKSREARRTLGEHYTTEENILKLIGPLFLDDLRAEFTSSKDSVPKLTKLRERLSHFRFLDPACGCGNFLVVAYRELRRLELDILRRLRTLNRNENLLLDVTMGLSVSLSQFFGIEIEEWPAKIAETAMFIVDHQANLELAIEFGQAPDRLPIKTSATIRIGNAIRIDWRDIVPPSDDVIVLGNPPFIGMSLLTTEQQADNRLAFALPLATGLRTGRLDYVACWYAKAIDYMQGTKMRCAFVSTNSITQGEQARVFGPLLASNGFVIDFAHRTFSWSSEAPGAAAVHVVIIGFSQGGNAKSKHLYDYPDIKEGPARIEVKHINIYLADSEVLAIGKHTTPLVDVPKLTEGNRPQDGGGLLVSPEERDEILRTDPTAAKYLRRIIGAQDMLHGEKRWCFWLVDAEPPELRSSSTLSQRLRVVTNARLASPTESAREKAKTPSLFLAIRQPTTRWLCMPRHSSENRDIIPMAYFTAQDIAHDSTLTLAGADEYLFGVLQSAMFTTWVKTVSGRLKSDIRVSPDLSYNSFPFPESPSQAGRKRVVAAAVQVLAVRESFTSSSLADLYDPTATPAGLVAAHRELDRAVDDLYGKRSTLSESERQAILFARYQILVDEGRLFPEKPVPKRGK